jgi:hypothetical protein
VASLIFLRSLAVKPVIDPFVDVLVSKPNAPREDDCAFGAVYLGSRAYGRVVGLFGSIRSFGIGTHRRFHGRRAVMSEMTGTPFDWSPVCGRILRSGHFRKNAFHVNREVPMDIVHLLRLGISKTLSRNRVQLSPVGYQRCNVECEPKQRRANRAAPEPAAPIPQGRQPPFACD